MPNTKPWREIRETRSKLSPAQRADIDQVVQLETTKMKLGELRKARRLSQAQIAESLGLSQGDVSKMERRAELYVSTLRRFIEAAGGELEVIARFPDAAPIALDFLTDGQGHDERAAIRLNSADTTAKKRTRRATAGKW
jgi:transcriptional regulator with XRE-family HTH domain